MKFLRYTALSAFLFMVAVSCEKKSENQWKIEVQNSAPAKITDISAEYFNPNLPLADFKQKYPWFQGTVTDEDFAERRTDATEIKIFRDAIQKIDIKKLSADLGLLFAQIHYYFPKFQSPQVFLYSSSLEGIKEAPIFLRADANMLFIDVSAFLGEGSPYYAGLEKYLQTSMNPANIVSKTSQTIAENMVPVNGDHQKFLDLLVYNGKIMTLQDAFLPGEPDNLKINYTPKQYEWAKANEANVWNYFVEKNLIFSDDTQLGERFVAPGPFSKFYAEIDNESSPQIGIFTGWQICRKFFEKNPDTKLQDFLRMNATEIFNRASYKPKNP